MEKAYSIFQGGEGRGCPSVRDMEKESALMGITSKKRTLFTLRKGRGAGSPDHERGK